MKKDNIFKSIYENLKNNYNISLTTTKNVDESYTIDTIAIVGSFKKGDFIVYSDGVDYVFGIDYYDNNYTHFHPNDKEEIISFIKQIIDEGDLI